MAGQTTVSIEYYHTLDLFSLKAKKLGVFEAKIKEGGKNWRIEGKISDLATKSEENYTYYQNFEENSDKLTSLCYCGSMEKPGNTRGNFQIALITSFKTQFPGYVCENTSQSRA